MANIGTNVQGHPIEVRIKGDGTATIGTLMAVGLHGIVIDTTDPGQPWHAATSDVARWRLACDCRIHDARPWECPGRDVSEVERALAGLAVA